MSQHRHNPHNKHSDAVVKMKKHRDNRNKKRHPDHYKDDKQATSQYQMIRKQSLLPLFLQRKIEFREVHKDSVSFSKPSVSYDDDDACTGSARSSKAILSSDQNLVMNWTRISSIGPGLNNVGNTCFLNSVLQCLLYTPPLANYLLSKRHSTKCSKGTGGFFCLLCELERLMCKVHQTAIAPCKSFSMQRSITPNSIVSNLRSIAKSMRVGRQEDAHEFFIFAMDAMQQSMNKSLSEPPSSDANRGKSLIDCMFEGSVSSNVKCSECGKISTRKESFVDLSLDVRSSGSVLGALKHFCRSERLVGPNQYRCESDDALDQVGCNRLVDAERFTRIAEAPPVLCIHLKRFQSHFDLYAAKGVSSVGKINRDIQFETNLDLTPFLQSSSSTANRGHYQLYAVLVHDGGSCSSGHYHAFVRAANGMWHSMDDDMVQQVSLHTVLKQQAYMLFYIRDDNAAVVAASEVDDDASNRSRAVDTAVLLSKKQRKKLKAALIKQSWSIKPLR